MGIGIHVIAIPSANLSADADRDSKNPGDFDKLPFRHSAHEVLLPKGAQILGVNFAIIKKTSTDPNRIYPMLDVLGEVNDSPTAPTQKTKVVVHIVTIKNAVPALHDPHSGDEIKQPVDVYRLGNIPDVPLERVGAYADPAHPGRVSFVLLQRLAPL